MIIMQIGNGNLLKTLPQVLFGQYADMPKIF
jgi:hypothetical protein